MSEGSTTRVLVLGGGIGGLTVAHELAERGFEITVVERQSIFGGKARSVTVSHGDAPGADSLPGEHGFRFFPGFYQHLPDTMARIPYPDPGYLSETVVDHLVDCRVFAIARGDGLVFEIPTKLDGVDFAGVRMLARHALSWNIKLANLAFIVKKLAWLLSLPRSERRDRLDPVSWWEFTEAARRGKDDPEYVKYLVDGITRSMVACRADRMNAYTAGTILLQLLRSMIGSAGHADRVLDGPTNERWIDPWMRYLQHLGVTFARDTEVAHLEVEGGRITGATVRDHGGTRVEQADWYVAAMPVERMCKLVDAPLAAADPGLEGLQHLETEWMNGVQIYLHEPLDLVDGHTVYSASPWALSSVEQQHHWPPELFARFGTVSGIVSVDVSNWEQPGLYGKPARECTKDEIVREVIDQLARHLPRDRVSRLDTGNIAHAFVDPDIVQRASGDWNEEPLLVNTVGAWEWRPEAQTQVTNLVLASDYVRTNTNLACMEGANEAARRAVNVILTAEGHADPCAVWDLHEFKGDDDLFAISREMRAAPEPGNAPPLEPDDIPDRFYSLEQSRTSPTPARRG